MGPLQGECANPTRFAKAPARRANNLPQSGIHDAVIPIRIGNSIGTIRPMNVIIKLQNSIYSLYKVRMFLDNTFMWVLLTSLFK